MASIELQRTLDRLLDQLHPDERVDFLNSARFKFCNRCGFKQVYKELRPWRICMCKFSKEVFPIGAIHLFDTYTILLPAGFKIEDDVLLFNPREAFHDGHNHDNEWLRWKEHAHLHTSKYWKHPSQFYQG